jgi:DNA-binding IclR family transcriptional regulator
MSPNDVKAALAGGLERFTEHTIVDARVLMQQLETVRTQGYAQTLEEHEVGLAAVAAPIRTLDGQVIAAITISGPTFRINEHTIPVVAPHLISAAAVISERNGYPKPG